MPAQQNESTILSLTHASGIFFGFIIPIIIFIVKKDGSEYFNAQIKEALNFQITIGIAFFASEIILGGLILFITPIIYITDLVFCIVAAIAVSKGKDYKYPIALRLVR
ncbi:MAG: DUF4870 domain-containing protein [Bacteroidota bacterium]|nr:DUF4870 domain-containing protein [Bacteroidota bacterium]